jgi:hypothetical protein
MRDAILISTNDDEVNYGSTQTATDLILQMPMMYNNGVYVGSGALSLNIPDGTVIGGNARGMGAIDLQTIRSSATQVASGISSAAVGGNNIASGVYSVAIGQSNYSTGTSSISMGNGNNSSNSYSVTMGQNNIASGQYGVAIGYNQNATGYMSTSIGGFGNTVPGQYSVGMGVQCLVSGDISFASGEGATTNGIKYKKAHGYLAGYQYGTVGVKKATTDATASILTSDAGAASTSNQCTLQNNNAIAFTIEVVARNTSTGMAGRWEAKGLIKRGANASATALVGTPVVTLTNADNEAWIVTGAIALTADTTYGALAVTVTGAASTTIHWLAKILTTEII